MTRPKMMIAPAGVLTEDTAALIAVPDASEYQPCDGFSECLEVETHLRCESVKRQK